MSRSLKGMLTLGLALGLVSVALGQLQGGAFGPGGMLLAPPVQKELKLSDDQVSKLKDALAKVGEKHKGDFQKFADMSSAERRKVMNSMNEDMHKAIDGILDAKQVKRFQQIEWQLAGPNALRDPRLQKELKLSGEQTKKLDTLFEGSDKKMQELFQGGDREGAREKFQQLRKDTEEKANGVLTADQKKQLKDLKGEEFKFPRPGGPGKQ